MKCEIITIYSFNYGNRLQNYALQEVLKGLGVNTTTNRVTNNVALYIIKKIVKVIRNNSQQDYFLRFDLKNIKFKYTSQNRIYNKKIDYYIAGSDQIWNPNFPFNSDREFLTFAPKQKKIAYAASIGINKLSEEQKGRFIRNLKDFKAISVRENDASVLIERIIKTKPEVVLDPTMLLSKQQWQEICKQSQLKIKKPFIVKYFLGTRNKKIDYIIDLYAKNNGLDIIDIGEKCNYIIGPSEFVYLLQNSKMNFVDSFHGTVFSIIFNRPFYTFNRPDQQGFGNMNSRFDTVISLFHLENRYVKDFDSFRIDDSLCFEEANKILKKEKNKSLEYLKKSLEVK